MPNRIRPLILTQRPLMLLTAIMDCSVKDPYRWLEDPDSAETRAWVESQEKLTTAYLAALPYRDLIRARLTA